MTCGFCRPSRVVADVLVGTHGAALVHAIFMRAGSSLVEIRPYGFDGPWPDQYHLSMARQENATHAFVIRTRDRTLCSPVPPANVSAWDARPLNTRVRHDAFVRALAAAACTSGRQPPRGSAAAAVLAVPAPAASSPFDYRALHTVAIDNG